MDDWDDWMKRKTNQRINTIINFEPVNGYEKWLDKLLGV